MNVITHALLPALLAAPLLTRNSPAAFYGAGAFVALSGALPDVLNPHLALAARYASWSHTVFALAGFGVLLALVRLLAPDFLTWKLALLSWFAYGLHLGCDAISGGIVFFRPVSLTVIGPHRRWVSYHWWMWLDLVCITATLALGIVMSHRFAREERGATKPDHRQSAG